MLDKTTFFKLYTYVAWIDFHYNVLCLIADRPHSFGLHSPDQIPPATETDFAAIACSFGLRSPDNGQSENLHPSYNPRLFSDGDLYLDPDIIGT